MSLVSFFPSPIKIDPFARLAKKKYVKIIQTINKTICFNQGALAQYIYLSGEKHKEMKDEFQSKGGPDRETLQKRFDDLNNHLNDNLNNIFCRIVNL